MNETLSHLTKVLPELAAIVAISGFFGWFLRRPPAAPTASKSSTAGDKGQQDRAKNLEAALEKSKAAHKALKAEFEKFQSTSVSQAAHELTVAERDAAREALATETKRIATLEADLKKFQESVKNLNGRANEADKVQKERSFAIENELSKVREQLAILQNRPDDSAELLAEIERLRESVAVSTRFAGEMRKREAAAIEALAKTEAKLADSLDPARPAVAAKKIGPVGDSSRIAAAKAEVIRLVELNRQKAEAMEEPTPDTPEPSPAKAALVGDEVFALE